MKKIYILFAIILSLFLATYLFTRPFIFEQFDFSQTGPIGDTIGGITSPIINLIAGFLVYYSFQEQVKANKILTDDRNFQVTLKLFDNLKESYKNLKYDNREGQYALNLYSNELNDIRDIEKYSEYTRKPIYFDYQFLFCEYDLLLNHLDNSKMDNNEKESLSIIIHNFFSTKLEFSVNIFIEVIEKFDSNNHKVNKDEFLIRNLKRYKKRALEFK